MMAIKVGRKNAQTSLKIIRFPDDLRLTNVAHLILRARSEPNCVLPREAITRVTPGGEGDFDIDEVAFDEEMDIALQEIDSSNLNLDYI
ncbi:unnamed protein product [Protopolystoma xenopodis]|uniref:Uncharacterized protein n=1 Tax=Protopolystoma xenopodis TaxID=117903 RepID=A0A3S5BRJ2_9PLAT|nr:unnamed protein product [Protopolystoma xenopodis]